jgi:hypothetical protein
VKLFFSISVFFLLSACTTLPDGGVVLNGKIVKPLPLHLGQDVEFRFAEKSRIAFSWFSGPAEINGCGFGRNPFKDSSDFKGLAVEKNAPHWIWNGAVVSPMVGSEKISRGKIYFSLAGPLDAPYDRQTLGTGGNHEFKGYRPFCNDLIAEAYSGATLMLIRDRNDGKIQPWIKNSIELKVNSNRWYFLEYPLSDFVEKYGNRPLLESWALHIPDTDYWMIVQLFASKQFSFTERREAFENTRRLFRNVIESVKLTSISPAVEQREIIREQDCSRTSVHSAWVCPFNPASINKDESPLSAKRAD